MARNVLEIEIAMPRVRSASRAHFVLCHFTTVHTELKSRSFHMQCKPLADAGVEVHYASPATVDASEHRHMSFIRLPRLKGRLRTLLALPSLLRTLLRVRAALYHFQDPELLPVAFVMKIVFRK